VIIDSSYHGQGASREAAALLPRYLGLQVVLAKSFARIHWQSLINFGVLPLTFATGADYEGIAPGATLRFNDIIATLKASRDVQVELEGFAAPINVHHDLSAHQIEMLA